MSHTPGPWSIERDSGDRELKDAAGNTLMCDMDYYPWTPDTDDDWNLIAAAPEMLGALHGAKALLEYGGIKPDNAILANVLAAISKATGRLVLSEIGGGK